MPIRNQAGDTIIEVLIAMVVVSAVLAGAYASSQRSFNSTIQSKERDEAVKLIQSQAELIKANVASTRNENNDFCMLTDGTVITYAAGFSIPADVGATDPSIYNQPECIRTNLDTEFDPADPDQQSFPHYVSVTRNPTGGGGANDRNLYLITVRWARAGGGGFDQSTLFYRVY